MLSGIKLVSKEDAERADQQYKARKEKKKRDKKKHKKRSSSRPRSDAPSSSSDGDQIRSSPRSRDAPDPAAPRRDKDTEHEAGGAGRHQDLDRQPHPPPALKREDWMTVPMGRSSLLSKPPPPPSSSSKGDQSNPLLSTDKAKPPVKELNPYMKDGGSGLPPLQTQDDPGCSDKPDDATHTRTTNDSNNAVGDGGASWRMKALRRARSQAADEGKPLNDVVKDRWGSVKELTAGVTAAATAAGAWSKDKPKPAHAMSHLQAARDRRGGEPSVKRRRSAFDDDGDDDDDRSGRYSRGGGGYLADVKTERGMMRRPKADDGSIAGGPSLSWRKRQSGKGGEDVKYRADGARGGRVGPSSKDGVGGGADKDGVGGGMEELHAAAGEMNEFEDDGSFMERYLAAQRKERGAAEPPPAAAVRVPHGDGPCGAAHFKDKRLHGTGSERDDRGEPRPHYQQRRGDAGARVGNEQRQPQRRHERDEDDARHDDSDRRHRPPRDGDGRASPPPRPSAGGAGVHGTAPRQMTTATNNSAIGADNKSAAALLRARLGGGGSRAAVGQTAPHSSSNAELKPQRGAEAPKEEEAEQKVIALPLVDAEGRAVPGAFGRAAVSEIAGAVRPTKRVERYEGGERKRYYADDDVADLATLVKRTKHEGVQDMDATLARNISRNARFKERDLMDVDAEYDHDAGLELVDSKKKASKEARRRGNAAEEASKRDRQRQTREFSKFQTALDRCALCFASAARPRHLLLAAGNAAYLALPARGRLTPGHCQIVPADHVASTRAADEVVYTEIRNFKKCLLRMFQSQGVDIVFVETALRPGDLRGHAVVDCVPMPHDAFAKAPMYFRKAVEDATSDWAQHAAKGIIDTSVKGLHGAIPPNFPYFHVEFGLRAGFVHVVDAPDEFPRDFARGVLAGLLGLPPEDASGRAKRESETVQSTWAAEFREQFDPFDWTKELG